MVRIRKKEPSRRTKAKASSDTEYDDVERRCNTCEGKNIIKYYDTDGDLICRHRQCITYVKKPVKKDIDNEKERKEYDRLIKDTEKDKEVRRKALRKAFLGQKREAIKEEQENIRELDKKILMAKKSIEFLR